MTIHSVQLEDRGVLRVAGEDAASFLQGLLTNDVESLGVGEARYAALLTPQGKILFDFLVLRVARRIRGRFSHRLSAGQAADLAKRLGFYRLRAKVTIADESAGSAVVALWGEEFGRRHPRRHGRACPGHPKANAKHSSARGSAVQRLALAQPRRRGWPGQARP